MMLNENLNVILFANGNVLLVKNDEDLQKLVNEINGIS